MRFNQCEINEIMLPKEKENACIMQMLAECIIINNNEAIYNIYPRFWQRNFQPFFAVAELLAAGCLSTDIVRRKVGMVDEGEVDLLKWLLGQLWSKAGAEEALHVCRFELALREHGDDLITSGKAIENVKSENQHTLTFVGQTAAVWDGWWWTLKFLQKIDQKRIQKEEEEGSAPLPPPYNFSPYVPSLHAHVISSSVQKITAPSLSNPPLLFT